MTLYVIGSFFPALAARDRVKAQVLIEMDSQQFKTFFSAFIIDSFNRFNQFSVYLLTNFITVKHCTGLIILPCFQ